jgi:hypothetical protein
MRSNLDLVAMPEWSDFFRSLSVHGALHVHWQPRGDQWTAQVVEFERDLSKPLTENPIGPEAIGGDRFDVLDRAMRECGREIRNTVWIAFRALRKAATGSSGGIEDLL